VNRRMNGEGSIHWLESRSAYRAQVTLRDGRRPIRQFPTRSAAAKWVKEQYQRDARGELHRGTKTTLAEWMDVWLAERVQTRRPATVATDQVHWRNHFDPIRDHPLSKLSTPRIRAWLESLDRSFVTEVRPMGQPHTVRSCFSLLHAALGAAVERGLLEAHPMARLKRPAVPKARPKYLAPDDLRVVLAHLRETGDPRELAVQLMVRLGLRRGEALGLAWGDVDLETGRIMIRLQLQKIPDPKGSGGMVLVRVQPKTDASVRMVRASGSLLDRLRSERARSGGSESSLVVEMNGRPVDPDVLTRWLARETAPLGIRCSPHRLRHTAATLMLNEVGSIATVSNFLGHSDIKMTSVYARVLAETTDAAAEALGAVVDGL